MKGRKIIFLSFTHLYLPFQFNEFLKNRTPCWYSRWHPEDHGEVFLKWESHKKDNIVVGVDEWERVCQKGTKIVHAKEKVYSKVQRMWKCTVCSVWLTHTMYLYLGDEHHKAVMELSIGKLDIDCEMPLMPCQRI